MEERRTGSWVALGSNPAGAPSLRNFDNSVYPVLPVSFGGDAKSRWSLLSVLVSLPGEVNNLSWTAPFLEKDKCKINPVYNQR